MMSLVSLFVLSVFMVLSMGNNLEMFLVSYILIYFAHQLIELFQPKIDNTVRL